MYQGQAIVDRKVGRVSPQGNANQACDCVEINKQTSAALENSSLAINAFLRSCLVHAQLTPCCRCADMKARNDLRKKSEYSDTAAGAHTSATLTLQLNLSCPNTHKTPNIPGSTKKRTTTVMEYQDHSVYRHQSLVDSAKRRKKANRSVLPQKSTQKTRHKKGKRR